MNRVWPAASRWSLGNLARLLEIIQFQATANLENPKLRIPICIPHRAILGDGEIPGNAFAAVAKTNG